MLQLQLQLWCTYNLYRFMFVCCLKPRGEFQTNLPSGPLARRVRKVYCKFIGGLFPVVNNFIMSWPLNGVHLSIRVDSFAYTNKPERLYHRLVTQYIQYSQVMINKNTAALLAFCRLKNTRKCVLTPCVWCYTFILAMLIKVVFVLYSHLHDCI